jgi:hypothetical protein
VSRVRVLETNVLHASDVIYWLDGSTAQDEADMLRLSGSVAIEFSAKPSDVSVLHGAGKTALLRRPGDPMIEGEASEQERAFSGGTVYTVAGTVEDPEGRYVPRRFSLDVGDASGHAVILYPTPIGTRFGRAGGLYGTVRFDTSTDPAAWALLTLRVTTAVGTVLTFRAQADGRGDFMLPMTRLPPLPEGIASYAAELEIAANETARPDVPVAPEVLVAMAIGALDVADSFATPLGFFVVPGTLGPMRSADRDHLAVQPV